jgi:hypothetical protein
MPAHMWRQWLRRATRSQPRPRVVLRLEELESRLTPSVAFLTTPYNGTAGQTLSPAVQVLVLNGGQPQGDDPVTLTVASGPGGFTTTSTTTVTTDGSGTATFNNLVLNTAGDYTFQAADVFSEGPPSSPSNIVTINPGPASQVVIDSASSQIPEGTPLSFVVGAVDRFGNPATGSTIHFSSSTTQASLPPDYTLQPADDGGQIFEATFTVPGTQTITAAVVGSNVSATVSVAVQPVPPDDIQLNLSASDVPVNQPVALTGTFTDPGTLDANTVVIDWDDGTADATLVLPAQVRSFNTVHAYTAEGDYFPTVSITNADGGTGENSSEEQVLPGSIDDVADTGGQPGQTVTSSITDADSDSISATLSLSPNDATGGGILVAKLANAPLPSTTNLADVLGIYDIRTTTPEAGDSALVKFRFRVGSNLDETPVLQFLNPATGTLQDFVPSSKPGSFSLTRQGDFIVGSLLLDNTSNPTLRQLTHTEFTISVNVPSAAATAAVSASLASANVDATAPVSAATFRTTSQLTLTLEPTQASQVSSGLSSFDATNSGGGGEAAPDGAAAALYSFLVEEVSDGAQAFWPFARHILSQTTPASSAEPRPVVPGKPAALRQDESLRDASDFLFRELASTVVRPAGRRPWALQCTTSDTKIGGAAFLAGLAVAMPERRKKDDRTKAEVVG